jgi:hypothetical protein
MMTLTLICLLATHGIMLCCVLRYFTALLSIVILSVTLNVVMLSVIMLTVVILIVTTNVGIE